MINFAIIASETIAAATGTATTVAEIIKITTVATITKPNGKTSEGTDLFFV